MTCRERLDPLVRDRLPGARLDGVAPSPQQWFDCLQPGQDIGMSEIAADTPLDHVPQAIDLAVDEPPRPAFLDHLVSKSAQFVGTEFLDSQQGERLPEHAHQ